MSYKIIQGDCLEVMRTMADKSVDCCITSPPYWGLRNYGVDGQLGLEKTPEEYVRKMVAVFAEVRRVLKDEGTVWLNLGDSYAANTSGGTSPQGGASARPKSNTTEYASRCIPDGLKPKDLCGIPWRVAFALQADGWWLRQDIVWSKPNPMPESVTDRCTKAHEYIFLLSKKARYYFDNEAIKDDANPDYFCRYNSEFWREGGKEANGQGRPDGASNTSGMKPVYTKANKRSVWTIPTQAFPEAHFATFPEALVSPCVLAGCPAGGTVLDPFNGAGTTGIVALKHGRSYLGIELNPAYVEMAEKRIRNECGLLIGSG